MGLGCHQLPGPGEILLVAVLEAGDHQGRGGVHMDLVEQAGVAAVDNGSSASTFKLLLLIDNAPGHPTALTETYRDSCFHAC